MAMCLDGDIAAYRIVSTLHEKGRFQHSLTFFLDLLHEAFAVLQTPIGRTSDNGIWHFNTSLLQGLQGRKKRTFRLLSWAIQQYLIGYR